MGKKTTGRIGNEKPIGNFKPMEEEMEAVGRPWIPLMCIGIVACAGLVIAIVALSLVVART